MEKEMRSPMTGVKKRDPTKTSAVLSFKEGSDLVS
jgi:hypothetical protein